jgi:hypothetical protein
MKNVSPCHRKVKTRWTTDIEQRERVSHGPKRRKFAVVDKARGRAQAPKSVATCLHTFSYSARLEFSAITLSSHWKRPRTKPQPNPLFFLFPPLSLRPADLSDKTVSRVPPSFVTECTAHRPLATSGSPEFGAKPRSYFILTLGAASLLPLRSILIGAQANASILLLLPIGKPSLISKVSVKEYVARCLTRAVKMGDISICKLVIQSFSLPAVFTVISFSNIYSELHF